MLYRKVNNGYTLAEDKVRDFIINKVIKDLLGIIIKFLKLTANNFIYSFYILPRIILLR